MWTSPDPPTKVSFSPEVVTLNINFYSILTLISIQELESFYRPHLNRILRYTTTPIQITGLIEPDSL